MGHAENHAELTTELAAALRMLGDLRSAAIKRRAEVWHQTAGNGITERREEVRYAVSDLDALIADQEMVVDSLRVQLRHLEWIVEQGG